VKSCEELKILPNERICVVGYPIMKDKTFGALFKMEGTIHKIEIEHDGEICIQYQDIKTSKG